MAKKLKPQTPELEKKEDFKVIDSLGYSIDYGYDHRIMSHKALASMSDAQIKRTIKRAQAIAAKVKEKQETEKEGHNTTADTNGMSN